MKNTCPCRVHENGRDVDFAERSSIDVRYSAPLQYECLACGRQWEGAGLRVLTEDEARAKRPWLYEGASKEEPPTPIARRGKKTIQ